MSESRFKFDIADEPLSFIKGLPVQWSYGEGKDKVTLNRAIKVEMGQPYILHVTSDHIISIINPEDRWAYEKLFAVNTTAIGGYAGVYADSDEEALNLFADHCAKQVPDPENEGKTKMRWPGLIQTWMEIVDDVGVEAAEQYSGDFYGPYGNEDWYFTEHGHMPTAEEVHDPKIPHIPDDLFPYREESYFRASCSERDAIIESFWLLRRYVGHEYGDHEWSGWLEDYIDRNEGTLFVATIEDREDVFDVVISDASPS